MPAPCRWFRRDRCQLRRFGTAPSPGVCCYCQERRNNTVRGAGDVVAITVSAVVDRLPAAARVRGCGGCRRRQRQLNRLLPIRFKSGGRHATDN